MTAGVGGANFALICDCDGVLIDTAKPAPFACLVRKDSVTGVTAATAAGVTVLGFIGGGHASDARIDRLHATRASRIRRHAAVAALVAQWTLSATAAAA